MKLKNQIKNPLIRFPRSALYSGLRLYKIQFTTRWKNSRHRPSLSKPWTMPSHKNYVSCKILESNALALLATLKWGETCGPVCAVIWERGKRC